ncbi:hypothetical protein HHI36_020313 [Cryptolaemus montrouzieri]|uniref:lysozyme n=1 Tax=Cryptolaemus montrouzieri TaxID=559131 RepID=A0ABD2NA93_9CUCU
MITRSDVSLVLLALFVNAKIYDKCELARELKYVHDIDVEEIPVWVCIAKHESGFNTSIVNKESGDHGLFQISDLYWCSVNHQGQACYASCSSFEDDDITDDVQCIRRIYNEHKRLSGNGYNAWVVYPLFCKNNIESYVEGCFNTTDSTTSKPVTSTLENEDEYEFPPLPVFPKHNEVSLLPPSSTISVIKVFSSTSGTVSSLKTTTVKPISYSSRQSTQIFKNIKVTTNPFSTSSNHPQFEMYKSKNIENQKLFLKDNNIKEKFSFSSSAKLGHLNLGYHDPFFKTTHSIIFPSSQATTERNKINRIGSHFFPSKESNTQHFVNQQSVQKNINTNSFIKTEVSSTSAPVQENLFTHSIRLNYFFKEGTTSPSISSSIMPQF